MTVLNDAQAVFYKRQLENIETEIYRVQYTDIMYRTLFPMKTNFPSWVQSSTYYTLDFVGQTEVSNSHAWDVKTVDVGLSPTTTSFVRHRIGYIISLDELAAAQAGNINLDPEKAMAARKIIEKRHNYITFFGDADTGIVGLFTDPNVTKSAVPNGAGGNPEWSTKTPQEILEDILAIFTSVNIASVGAFRANKLILPVAQWNYIFSTPWSTTGDTRTIAEHAVSFSPYLSSVADIVAVPELAGSGAGGTDQMFAYNPSMENLHTNMADDIRSLPSQEFAENFRTILTAKFGGLQIKQPLSLQGRTGI